MKLTKITLTIATAAALMATAACGDSGGDPLATTSSSSSGGAASSTIKVGSADFPESALLAEIYAGALEAKGVKVEKKLNIGAREAYIPALQDGSIDLIPEYTGVLRDYFKKGQPGTDAEAVYTELKASVPATLTVLDKSAAEDKDALVMKKSRADELGVKSIADLAGKAGKLTVGGPPEWKTRDTGIPGFKKIYGLEFKAFRPLDAGGPLTLAALKNGQIDAGDLFTTDPSIAAERPRRARGPEEHVCRAERRAADHQEQEQPDHRGCPQRGLGQARHGHAVRPAQAGRRRQEGRRHGRQGVPDQGRPRLTTSP